MSKEFLDLELTESQRLVVETSIDWMESTYSMTAVRDRIAHGADPGQSYAPQAAELGWFSMCIPEEFGGGSVSANGVVDLALIAQARGRLVQPMSFVGTNVLAFAIANAGSHDQRAKILPSLISGQALGTWVHAWPGTGAGTAAAAAANAGGYTLTGTSTFVQDANLCSWMLVTAVSEDDPVQLIVATDAPGVSIRCLDGLDLSRRFCEVSFEGVELSAEAVLGKGGQTELIDRQLDLACALTVAESVGTMEQDFELALEYAKVRTAFGRPIGSFQAIKPLLADTSLMLEMSKACALAAAVAVGANEANSSQVASMAKAFVGDCGVELAQNCFQIFGGIGQTWEHDQHFYVRRLTTDASLYGNPDWHRERLCQLGGV